MNYNPTIAFHPFLSSARLEFSTDLNLDLIGKYFHLSSKLVRAPGNFCELHSITSRVQRYLTLLCICQSVAQTRFRLKWKISITDQNSYAETILWFLGCDFSRSLFNSTLVFFIFRRKKIRKEDIQFKNRSLFLFPKKPMTRRHRVRRIVGGLHNTNVKQNCV